jgi:hypothetical protein
MSKIDHYAGLAERIVDLSADFRLRNPDDYVRWYGKPHTNPAWLERFVYGLPELHREALRTARYVSGVGCNATATNLAIYPLFAHKLVDEARGVICEVKVGSSEGGNASSDSTHHPERSGVMRSFAPTGHRHTAEILQALARGRECAGRAPERHGGGQCARRAGDGACLRQAGRGRERDLQGVPPGYRNEPFVRWSRSAPASTATPNRRFWPAATTPTWALSLTRTGRVVASAPSTT